MVNEKDSNNVVEQVNSTSRPSQLTPLSVSFKNGNLREDELNETFYQPEEYQQGWEDALLACYRSNHDPIGNKTAYDLKVLLDASIPNNKAYKGAYKAGYDAACQSYPQMDERELGDTVEKIVRIRSGIVSNYEVNEERSKGRL